MTADMKKPLVVYEPNGGGHQLYHVRMILEATQAAGLPAVFATTQEALDDKSAAPLRRVLDAGGTQVIITRPEPGFAAARRVHPVLQQQFVYTRALRIALQAAGGKAAFSHVFVPFFDAYMTSPLALRMDPCLGIPMSGILHRTRFHMPSIGIRTTLPFHVKIERYVYASLLKRRDVSLLFTMDPYLDKYYGSDRVRFLPDPGVHAPGRSREEVRSGLGIAPDQLCILVHGALDHRKAVGPLLEAVSSLPDPGQVVVVLAGRQDEQVRGIMAGPGAQKLLAGGHVKELAGFLDDQTVYDLLGACDVCWVCYVNSDGNSGVMMKAGQARRPVITATSGIGARLVEDDGIGWTADPASPASIAKTLLEVLHDPAKREATGNAIFNRFQSHTVENFVNPIIAHLSGARVA